MTDFAITNLDTLNALQEYIQEATQRWGFNSNTAQLLVNLLAEEVGEVSKAVRKETGQKIDTSKANTYPKVEEELADVIIVTITLANHLNIRLYDAVLEKLMINENRRWS
jgi:NTP pyrophosphatase (non-canonical NTP hydrolase)